MTLCIFYFESFFFHWSFISQKLRRKNLSWDGKKLINFKSGQNITVYHFFSENLTVESIIYSDKMHIFRCWIWLNGFARMSVCMYVWEWTINAKIALHGCYSPAQICTNQRPIHDYTLVSGCTLLRCFFSLRCCRLCGTPTLGRCAWNGVMRFARQHTSQ